MSVTPVNNNNQNSNVVQTKTQNPTQLGASTKDTIAPLDGYSVLGLGNVNVNRGISIMQLLEHSNGALLVYFNELLEQSNQGSLSSILNAAIQSIQNLPSQAAIEARYALASQNIADSNALAEAYNDFANQLNNLTTGMDGNIDDAAANLAQLLASNSDGQLENQSQQIIDLANEFQNSNGSMSVEEFQSQLVAILTSAQSVLSDATDLYNETAGTYASYLAQYNNYNGAVGNPPLTEAEWEEQVAATNAWNEELGEDYPPISALNPPTISLVNTLLPALLSNLQNGKYDNSVTFPDPSTYDFYQRDGNGNILYSQGPQMFDSEGNPIVDEEGNPMFHLGPALIDLTSIDRLLQDISESYAQARSTVGSVKGDLEFYVDTDLVNQKAEMAAHQPPVDLLDIQSLAQYSGFLIRNIIRGTATENANFQAAFVTNQNATDNASQLEKERVQKLLQEKAETVGIASLGDTGGSAINLIGGVTSYTTVTNVFINSMKALDTKVKAFLELSTTQEAFTHATVDSLRLLRAASSISGLIQAFSELTEFDNPNRELVDSVNALTNLESEVRFAPSYASVADKASADPLNFDGSIPYSVAVLQQRTALGAQNIQDPGEFAILQFIGFVQDALDAKISEDPLGFSSDAPVYADSIGNAQSTLVDYALDQKVSIDFLNTDNPSLTSQVSSSFQRTAQDLASRGIEVSQSQLNDVQSELLANLSGASPSGQDVITLIRNSIAKYVADISKDAVTNSVFVHFIQNDPFYRIQTQNDFKENSRLNAVQAQDFTARFQEALRGDSYRELVDFISSSDLAEDPHFAENLTRSALTAADHLKEHSLAEGPHLIPGTDLLANALVARNDLTVSPTERRSTYFPV